MPKIIEIPVSVLKEVFTADFDAGILLWKKKVSRRVCIGDEAGTKRPSGHLYVQLNKKHLGVHRIMWAMYYGEWPSKLIDHKNRNPADNKIINLRLATKSQNGFNRAVNRKSTTGVKGVFLNKKTGAYKVQIRVNKKTHYLGLYKDIDAAKNAYITASKEYHGEYSIHN